MPWTSTRAGRFLLMRPCCLVVATVSEFFRGEVYLPHRPTCRYA